MQQHDRGRTASGTWSPDQYLKFSDHRLRPALELLERVPLTAPEVVYDIGCGAGEIARLMAERWPSASVTGLDSSANMLTKAATTPSRVRWVQDDIAAWQPEDAPDLIYSNATLQWITGHSTLFPRLVSFLRPGGVLAVQVPLSWGMPSHVLMRKTLDDGGPGGSRLGTDELRQGVARKWVDDADEYYDLLVGQTRSLDIWETEYLQILSGDNPVLEWVKGTGLRPILDGLNDAERQTYLTEYAARLRATYPMRPDGHILYPFRRLFIVATV